MKKNEVKTEKTYIEGVRINFLYVDKYSFGRAWYMPESKIPYSMLRYIISGKAIFFINGKELTVEKNQVVYIPRGCELSCHALGDSFSFMSIRFNTSISYDGGDFLKAINEQISNFAQSYPANSITASIEAPLLINRYRFVSCSCFSCFCKKA